MCVCCATGGNRCVWGEASLLKGCRSITSTFEKCILSGVIHVIGVWISSGCSIIATERLCAVFAATEEK